MQSARTPETLVFARPHFRQAGNNLHFFLSERVYRSLTPAEALIWEKLKSGPATLKELPDEPAVESLAQARIVELVAPIHRADRRQILVVEPHCDDAALSVGATMWQLREEAEFHVLTMASRSNYTTAFHLHRDYFNRSEITKMRTAEGELFAHQLGGHYYCAGMAEATLRYEDSDWDLSFFNAHEVPIAISNNRPAAPSALKEWTQYLRDFVSKRRFAEIWIPLGAGNHADHDLARNAALQAIAFERPDAVVRIYEDVPYGAQFQEHRDRLLRILSEAGARLKSWWPDVSENFRYKLSLLEIFASQFKVASILPGVERSAGVAPAAAPVERLWTVEELPGQLPVDKMWVGAPDIAQARPTLRDFISGSGAARRVAILAIGAAGRWAEDFGELRKTFPKARFIVYAGPKVCAEFLPLKDARIEVHCLDGSAIAWVKAALREVSGTHRIIIASDAMTKAKALMWLWPTGRKMAVAEMDHLIQGLTAS
jgi:LmbE family N-acetylglucosaminyl deacetylase